jgi:hypothetical protein
MVCLIQTSTEGGLGFVIFIWKITKEKILKILSILSKKIIQLWLFRLDGFGGSWRKRLGAGFRKRFHIRYRNTGFIFFLIFRDTAAPAVFA